MLSPNQNNFSDSQQPLGNGSPVTSSGDNVYVMPEKFHGTSVKSSSDKKLIIVVIVLAVLIVASGSYFAYNAIKNKIANTPVPPVNENQEIVVPPEDQNIGREDNRDANNNLNVEEDANVNANTNTSTSTEPDVISLIKPTISGDADKDNLTDLEEALFGTSATTPDTDKDGYLDSVEVLGGYNPAVKSGVAKARLNESDSVAVLETNFATDNFKTMYIKGWSINFIDALHEARITTATGELIKISVAQNEDQSSATSWYLLANRDSNITLSQLDKIEFGKFKGIYSPNHLEAYLTDDKRSKIYIFKYDMDGMTEFNYPTIFEMIIKNFQLAPDKVIPVIDNTTATSTGANL